MKSSFFILFLSLNICLQGQTIPIPQNDFDRALKVGEIIVNGLGVLKGNKAQTPEQLEAKTVSSVCFKNKLSEKLTIKLQGTFLKKDDETESELVKKELVIQPNSEACLYDLQKGIWDYEFIKVTNNEMYKKGQYKIEDNLIITAKE